MSDVKSEAERAIEIHAFLEVQHADGLHIQGRLGHGQDVVAHDDARFRKPAVRPHLHFGGDAADGASDRGADKTRRTADFDIEATITG